DSPEAQERDRARQTRLESLGVRFLRFREEEVQHQCDRILDVIQNWIEHPPNPSLHPPNPSLHPPNPSLHTPNPSLHTPNPSQEGSRSQSRSQISSCPPPWRG
ncbi:MAG: DUF559 domain-containing protein, partial [Elainellaceae cyanobacterium]